MGLIKYLEEGIDIHCRVCHSKLPDDSPLRRRRRLVSSSVTNGAGGGEV